VQIFARSRGRHNRDAPGARGQDASGLGELPFAAW
jgi:hypothetical protein